VYGIDFLGRDVVRGYGSALVPLSPGHHVLDLPVYVPMSSSIMSDWVSWMWGNPPEVCNGCNVYACVYVMINHTHELMV
jgi:B9 domain-containing protein 1